MKRYAITLALVVFIAASLTTFYAYGADLHLPEYRLQTIEGDPVEAAALTLSGSYVGGKGSYSIKVSASGSERYEPSAWNQWMQNEGPLTSPMYSDFNALYEKHSGFMRGKVDTYSFYTDEDSLIFAKAAYTKGRDSLQDGTIRWSLDSLDLASGKQTHYWDEQQLEPASNAYAYVVDVQKAGAEVHVLTNVNRVNQTNEIIDKVFDTITGDPIRSIRLPLGEPSEPDRELQIMVLAEEKPTAANSRVLFLVREQRKNGMGTAATASDTAPAVFSEKLYEYQYASGEVKELPLVAGTEENNQVTSAVLSLEGETLIALQKMEESVTIDRFDLSAGLAQPQVTIKTSQLSEKTISQAQVANGRVYLLLQADDYFKNHSMPIAIVADATDGRILYKGTPALVKANGRPDDQLDDVWLSNMLVLR
ncbi:hypothetical protein [Cohnella fermenti]|uniref:Uncharacterized protein n=1 Tax=Cohnella fermenti TaxID=2565925 RepID=A0A4S4BU42_9BACL|nr:hypothetical protein [Cohnella fermenti]THF76417.1 hypothetical protein E6C55_19300 [Cohnella fermenti]